ncbi:MAG TPA: alpha/beta hydrolase [Candidatus Faecivivens stercoravium]|uniref:Alpha/beta hydrolase n=1 Tax=Candidatus Faecivivens stercoravium TaxID=2840803 RepID=A0A9D1DW73_9FIRM|nr:alpha/beta hydrolase [Candidatus Faecivivens stercoravium]
MMKTLEINGVTLAYEEYGSGNRYLISSQNFFFRDCHMALLGREPYHYHVFLIYTRGYGASTHIFDPTPRDYTTIWGKDVAAFAEAMGINSFYYTGISHGNWAGWYLALNRPELLRGFACGNGIAQFRDPDARTPVPPRPELDLDRVVGNREALEKMAWMENWPTESSERLRRRAQNHEEHLQILLNRKKEEFTVRNTNMSCCDAKTREEFYETMAKIDVPVLFLHGMLDPLAKIEDVIRLSQAIPGSQIKAYQNLGHGGGDECPEIFARDCDRFFRDTEGRVL